MKMQTPRFLHKLFPELIWKEHVTSKEIYLTFDDGPHPNITPKILNILAQYDAMACFFCVGENVQRYPETLQSVLDAGHQVGNHTFNHMQGWKVPDNVYLENIEKCNNLVHSRFFRPPHGKIRRSQIKKLKENYNIVMWTVITHDYDPNYDAEICLKKAIQKTRPGDVVVFHDSVKAEKNVLYVLPRFLEHFSKLGYRFVTWG
jgi:peptidoglycan/xylan/chitin deacetylase (PgdA/CDA1 family)